MDYQKMTKDELIEKLQEQKHLAEAVDAKDLEITKLKQQNQKQIEQLNKDLNDIKRENVDLKQRAIKESELVKKLELAENDYKKLLDVLNSYVSLSRSLIKNIQGGLDNANELEKILSKNFN